MTSLHLILAIFALMLGFGLLMVLSSSSVTSFRAGGSSFSVFANQATYAAVGLIGFFAAQYLPVTVDAIDSRTIAVIVSLALLVAVLVPGRRRAGQRRAAAGSGSAASSSSPARSPSSRCCCGWRTCWPPAGRRSARPRRC